MRLIDADALKKNMKFTCMGIMAGTESHNAPLKEIDDAPTIELERKKGKWIHDNPNTFRCSRCNKYLDISCGNMKMNFCPNCGADMRGEQDEDR